MRNSIVLLFFLLLSGGYVHAQSMSAGNLRCEYMHNPLGIDVAQPRFAWELASSGKNKKQTAYQIVVSEDPALPAGGVWDSGKTAGDETNQIHYQGRPFKPFTCYYWQVRVWDEQGKPSAWSPAAKFSTGPLSDSDWTAQWIGDANVPITKDNRYYPHLGYFSDYAYQPYAEKWVVIDLGEMQAVDEVKLFPADKKEKLFPLHFKVEIAEDAAFTGATIMAGALNDEATEQSFPYTVRLSTPARGRYVKLTVTKLPSVKKGVYEYGLSEIELLYRGKNLALNKPVQVSDEKIEYHWGDGDCKWLSSLLTDGYYASKPGDYYANIPPSPLLRKEINIGKKIKHALYHTSALGIYEAYINGKKVGRQFLAPEWTDYGHHVQYQTHDVTGMLQKGANALGVMLADGWYSGARWSHPGRGGYGSLARKFIGQLVVCYEDGTTETIGTDNTWKYLAQGPVMQATFFGGEEYDAKNDPQGWDKPGFDDSQWSAPAVYPGEDANLCAQLNEPIAVISEHKALSVHKVGENKYIFDLGQNIVGWCRLSLSYNPGQTLTFRYGEVLNDDKTLYTENLRGARQTDVYHPAREKRIDYEPRFTYHGFRFVEVDGLTQPPQPGNIRGKMIASSSPKTGTFVTSDKDVNKLWENIRWTQWGNMISVPTDCPQRDEREGWTGDAQVFSQTAIYNLDMAGFYTKWMRDIRDDQLPDGRLPDISPNDGQWAAFYNAPGWADAGVIIPWRMYQNYNDTGLLAAQYDAMKRFIDFIHQRNPGLLWRFSRGHMYGDWLNGNTIVSDDYPNTGGQVPNDVYSTIYFAYSTGILAKAAKLLGKESDYAWYSALAGKIKQAFAAAYISSDGKIEGDTQAGYAMALEWEMIPEALRTQAAANMAEAVKAYDYRISTGIHSTIRLMKQLCNYGYADIAYRLLTSRRFPSWLYSIDQGATTIWERWDGYVAGRGFQDAGMNSFNHVAIGAVGEWMYSHILGIRPDENHPGYRRFTVKPLPGGGLEWAKGSYHAITGTIEVAWTDRNRTFTLDVTVPPNTEATIATPYDNKTHTVGSGKHHFSVKY
ncbi:MAG: family 78 glycoside hydrolase catalytic domain [Tannerellaceae bacterium]|jgi:alpha-L-rhamnosidase|nr:family 78 glycoside hydrolase catalytic domain [Tannerellaceae bacterium]